jgi:hypothetical protein
MKVSIVVKRAKPTLTVTRLAERGHVELIKNIRRENIPFKIIREGMLKAAAGGHLKTMQLFKKLGAKNYRPALEKAALNGRVDAMIMLNEWGAKNYDLALGYAARGGHVEAITLIKKWGEFYW